MARNQPAETSNLDVFSRLAESADKYEARVESMMNDLLLFAKRKGIQNAQASRKDAEDMLKMVDAERKKLLKQQTEDEKTAIRKSQRNVHALTSAFSPQSGITRFIVGVSRSNSGFASFIDSMAMFGRASSAISQVISQVGEWIKSNRTESAGSAERGRKMGGGTDEVKQFQRLFSVMDQNMNLGENWSENFMGNLEDIGFKFDEANVAMRKFWQSAANENLGQRSTKNLANMFVDIQKQERKANAEGRRFALTQTQIRNMLGDDNQLTELFLKNMKESGKSTYDIAGSMDLINKIMEDTSRKKITPEAMVPEWVKFKNYLSDQVWKAVDNLGNRMNEILKPENWEPLSYAKGAVEALQKDIDNAQNSQQKLSAQIALSRTKGGLEGFGANLASMWGMDKANEKSAQEAFLGGQKTGSEMTRGLMMSMQQIAGLMEEKGKEAVRGFNKGVEVKSPSRAFFKSGVFIDRGLEQGIDSRAGYVQQSLAGLLAPPSAPAPAAGGAPSVSVGSISTQFNVSSSASAEGLGESLLLQTANVINQALTGALSSFGG